MSWLFSDTDDGPQSTRWSFVSGVVVGAVVLAMLWTVVALTAGTGRDSGAEAGGPNGEGEPTVLGTETADAEPSPAAQARRLPDACRQVHAAQTPVLRAAAASLAGWEVHVDAMNQLVAGDITLAQASDFWTRTRRQAAGLLARYDDAAAVYGARITRCPTTSHDRHDGHAASEEADQRETAAESAGCRSAVVARNAVLRRARTALATWRAHVHHMEMLRDGTLSPTRALDLWQQSWRTGMAELGAYDTARRAAAGHRC
jgi:hypothetical protein